MDAIQLAKSGAASINLRVDLRTALPWKLNARALSLARLRNDHITQPRWRGLHPRYAAFRQKSIKEVVSCLRTAKTTAAVTQRVMLSKPRASRELIVTWHRPVVNCSTKVAYAFCLHVAELAHPADSGPRFSACSDYFAATELRPGRIGICGVWK